MSVIFTAQEPKTRRDHLLRTFRRSLRPVVIRILLAVPSPEGCGCKGRKEWLVRQISSI